MNAIHVGVCSWSLRPATPQALAEAVRATGLSEIQLALGPIVRGEWDEAATTAILAGSGVRVVSGMMDMVGEDYTTLATIRATGGIVPDDTWEANLASARKVAALAERLGLGLVTFHAGFVEESGERRAVAAGRLRTLADVFGDGGVSLGLETGQESAELLESFLDEVDRPGIGVNFDPANMVLYGMGDPVEGLRALGPRVLQIHVKDALPTDTPGNWGAEVPVGEGAVDWRSFFDVYRSSRLRCDLIVEREAGDNRIGDIRRAVDVVASELMR